MGTELVQYYIVNKDLNMSAGKIAAQVAHVADDIADEIISNKIFDFEAYQNYRSWKEEYCQKKIILGGHQRFRKVG